MKRIILAVVMSLVLLNVGLVDFSYAGDLSRTVADLKATEIAEDNATVILAQAYNEPAEEEKEIEEEPEPVEEEEPELEEEEEPEPEEEEYKEIKE